MCSPALDAPIAQRTFFNSHFSNRPEIDPGNHERIGHVFYGPVWCSHPTASPLVITLNNDPADLSSIFSVTVNRHPDGPLSNTIVLRGDGVTLPLAGTYRVRPRLDPQQDGVLECDGLMTPPGTIVPVGENFEYVFVLESDCNFNSTRDDIDIANDPLLDVWPPDGVIDSCQTDECHGDYNIDGNLDQDDVTCLINQVGGGEPCYPYADPDFNRDGNVDQDDVADLVNFISSGECP
jgi:hypothetical protein